MPDLPLPPGLSSSPAALFDEHARPDFRTLFGSLATRATHLATAVTRIRLGTLDFTEEECSGIRSFHVLVAELNAIHLDAEARVLAGQSRRTRGLSLLSDMLEAGTLEIRSAPLGGWSPDFTVFGDTDGPTAVLLGFHQFGGPFPHRGPALASLHGKEGAVLARRRHDDVWEQAHDVGPAIWSLLARARRQARVLGPDPTSHGPSRPVRGRLRTG